MGASGALALRLAGAALLLALALLCLGLKASVGPEVTVLGAAGEEDVQWEEEELDEAGRSVQEERRNHRAEKQEKLTLAWQKFADKRAQRRAKAAQAEKSAWLSAASQAAEEVAAAAGAGLGDRQAQALGAGAASQALSAESLTISDQTQKVGEKIWVFCAAQWEECLCNGKIRWGNKGKYQEIKPKNGQVSAKAECAVGKSGLKDVLPGDNAKHCECAVATGSAYYYGINPMVLPKDAPIAPGSKTVGDCEIYREAQRNGPHDAMLWEAMSGFCIARKGVGGDKALDSGSLRKLAKVWVDARFAGNYERLYDSSGWLHKAFVVVYSAPPIGDLATFTKLLIQSVHTFSTNPIVMINFGMATPTDWLPDKYPRLVVLHASPMPAQAMRSTTLDMLRAMLLSRVKVGISLEMDTWVAPGVDNFFERIEQEITKEYPLPIMPVHFLDKKAEPGTWWHRFCPSGMGEPCRLQTTRWGQAHPTWSYWAIPFLGRWLRRNLRDEMLFARSDMEDTKENRLRVSDIAGAEDLLNMAIWEESGTKAWCKWDVPDPSEYEALLNSDKRTCKTHCDDIASDARFHTAGVPKVFYAAYHAVNAEDSAKYIAQLAKKKNSGDLPPPILFKGRFYQSGKELRRAYPSLRCLI